MLREADAPRPRYRDAKIPRRLDSEKHDSSPVPLHAASNRWTAKTRAPPGKPRGPTLCDRRWLLPFLRQLVCTGTIPNRTSWVGPNRSLQCREVSRHHASKPRLAGLLSRATLREALKSWSCCWSRGSGGFVIGSTHRNTAFMSTTYRDTDASQSVTLTKSEKDYSLSLPAQRRQMPDDTAID